MTTASRGLRVIGKDGHVSRHPFDSQNTHPKFVQELPGHATIARSLDTYNHAILGMGAHTARATEDALEQNPPKEKDVRENRE